ncbi:MAG: ubiquinone/menaquinone biosynthesis C-methylase UbiE, partial [Flavobacteriaceae bacterium]
MIDNFSNPKNNIEQLGNIEGVTAVDFGAGSGHYSYALAEAVGVDGKVYALEIQRDLLQTLKNTAEERGLGERIISLWCDLEKLGGSKLSDSVADIAIVSNVLFQVEKKDIFLKEVRRVMKKDALLLIVDWIESFKSLGPQPYMVFNISDAKELA